MWISNPSELFSSIDIIPTQGDDPSDMFNKLSRLLILVSLIVWWNKPELVEKVLLYGFIVILSMYVIAQDNLAIRHKKKEKFSPLSYKMEHPTQNSKTLAAIKNLPKEASPPIVPPISPPLASTVLAAQASGSMTIPLVQNQIPSQTTSLQSLLPPSLVATSNSANTVSIPVNQEPIPSDTTSLQSLLSTNSSNMTNKKANTQTVYVAKELLPEQNKVANPFTVVQSSSLEESGMRPPQKFYTPYVGVNAKMYQPPILAPRMMDSDFSDIESNKPVNFNPLQDMGMRDERTYFSQPQKKKPNTSMLIDKTDESEVSECIPTSKFMEGNNKFYMQDIQPNTYTFSYDRTPINSTIGISYTPQIPPLQKMRMCNQNGENFDVFTRIDPQLIRDDVPAERKEELPPRGHWSEKMGGYEASSSMDGVTSIYDPRFTGYGDEYRSYQDVNLGNVKYYYTDVDAYRSPNFVIRNKVDHVDMKQPMGDIYSSYPRESSLEDVRDIVNNDWMAKSMQHREDLMERQMRKNNARNWQMRFAPRQGGAHLNTFTSSY